MASVTKMHTLLNLSSTLRFAKKASLRLALFALRIVKVAGKILVLYAGNARVVTNLSMVCAREREDGGQTSKPQSLRRAMYKNLSAHLVNLEKVYSAMINLNKVTHRPQVLLGRIAQQTYLMSVEV